MKETKRPDEAREEGDKRTKDKKTEKTETNIRETIQTERKIYKGGRKDENRTKKNIT